MTQTRWLAWRRMPWSSQALLASLGVCAAVILVTTVFIIFQILRIQFTRVEEVVASETPTPVADHAEEHEGPPFSQSYEIQGMTISLANRNQTLAAFAEFNLVLDCPNPDSKRWMELNRAVVRDAVYESTVSFTVEEFSSAEGFSKIKKAILDELKKRFGKRAPRDIALRDWVIR